MVNANNNDWEMYAPEALLNPVGMESVLHVAGLGSKRASWSTSTYEP